MIRDLPLGASVKLFGRMDIGMEDYRACRRAGIECVELCFEEDWEALGEADLREHLLRHHAMAEACGVRLWSLHLPYGWEEDVSGPREEWRIPAVRRHLERIRAARGLGIAKLVLHGSFEPIDPAERSARIRAMRTSLAELGEAAAAQGMQLALECLPRTCMGNTIAEVREIMEGLKGVGLCCDTNHLLGDCAADFIRAFGDRIVTLHISDYDRIDERHWMPGEGVNDWNAILAALEEVGYDGPAMFELWEDDPERLRACWDGLVRSYEAAKA